MPSMHHTCERRALAIRLRKLTEADGEFVFSVYASTREEELARVAWDAGQKERFLRAQFEAQRQSYQSGYPGAEFQLITVAGKSTGRFYVQRRSQEIRIMDIALLPEFRNRGIGTGLLKGVLTEGERTNRFVSIHAEVFNPALRLYERLGFTKASLNGVYYLLEWRPGSSLRIDNQAFSSPKIAQDSL